MLLALFVAKIVCAQAVEEVTLVVSSDGATKEDAVKFALRSAIEQAYGTFVSANTSILNDELVKDEIVTVSSGNVKSYEEIVSETLPNGRFFVTLKATVSLSKLISYAQSKGAECEFAGATFGMQVKLEELNRENISKVFENLALQYKEIIPSCFDYKINAEPAENFNEFVNRSFEGVGSYKSREMCEDEYKNNLQNMLDTCYAIKIFVTASLNKNFELIRQLVTQTLQGISVSTNPPQHDIDKILGMEIKQDFFDAGYTLPSNIFTDNRSRESSISSIKPIRFGWYSLIDLLNTYYLEARRSFSIVVNDKDTLNCVNWFTTPGVYKRLEDYKKSGRYVFSLRNTFRFGKFKPVEELFYYIEDEHYHVSEERRLYWSDLAGHIYKIPNAVTPNPYFYLNDNETIEYGLWAIHFLYPKSDIAKLTNFKVVGGLVKF